MLEINFSKKLYKMSAIKDAVNAYSKVVVFSVSSDKDVIKVKAKGIDQEKEELIKDEFCNYVLAGMQQQI
ncbi:MAG: HxsD-like protein [Minisyncoccales bacterium]|jgi:hypothetical protein